MKTKAIKAPAAIGLGDFAAPAPETNKRPTHETVAVDAATAKQLDAFVKAKSDLDSAKAIVDATGVVLKEFGRKWLVPLLKAGKDATSVILASPKNGAMYIPTDRFARIKPENLDAVREVVGAENVNSVTEYTFDTEMVAKYGPQIAQALKSLQIPEGDKLKLLVPNLVHTYTFGLNDVARVATERGVSIETVLDTVGVVEQMKVRGKSK